MYWVFFHITFQNKQKYYWNSDASANLEYSTKQTVELLNVVISQLIFVCRFFRTKNRFRNRFSDSLSSSGAWNLLLAYYML